MPRRSPAQACHSRSPSKGAELPDPRTVAGVIITGAAAMVTEELDWSERTAAWIPAVLEAETPLLGICYGHQLIAHALDGRVAKNLKGREMGTVEVRLTEAAENDPILRGRSA